MFKPRLAQQAVLAYTGGKMGVSAVPGSGKTHTLSALAARLISENMLSDDQEVLIVTLVNSAVDNFTSRVGNLITQADLLPDVNYRVRTLHGLAHDIVRERPDLAGISDRFSIIDERESGLILQDTVQTWLRGHSDFVLDYTAPEKAGDITKLMHRYWPELAADIAYSFIRQAKDLQLTPQEIRLRLDRLKTKQPLLEMGVEIYDEYQKALNYRGAIDFDDLIRLALKTLDLDPDFLAHLQERWPYILEDEAQDSSRLQEEILRRLAGKNGNWVRMGDPNQAIYETFTTASPEYLIHFLKEDGVMARDLPNSGRSTASIVNLANYLISWTNEYHPVEEERSALTIPYIQLTPPGDPQPNPPDNPQGIYIHANKISPEDEIRIVVNNIQKWIPSHPQETVAVLVPRNERGAQIVEGLKKANIDYVEMLRSSLSTRQTARMLASILKSLQDPENNKLLSEVYTEIRHREAERVEYKELIVQCSKLLGKCTRVEEYLWPRPGRDWLEMLADRPVAQEVLEELTWFQQLIQRWQKAASLPVDQLLLTISVDVFTQPSDLALAHKLALVLERAARAHPDWRLPEFAVELERVAKNEQKFIGFSEEDNGFDPDDYKGKVAVATIHKAKGLEWDRVYLLSVNNYDFPSALPGDPYIGEKWFIKGNLNLPVEILARLKYLAAGETAALYEEEGTATYEARITYSAERLRLLYVGITRARKELMITWNSGKNGDMSMSTPLKALVRYLEARNHAPAE